MINDFRKITLENGFTLGQVVSDNPDKNGFTWNQLFMFSPDQPYLYDGGRKLDRRKETLQQIYNNFKKNNSQPIVVDYNHSSMLCDEIGNPISTNPDDIKAAGWIHDLEMRQDGLYALIEWTDEARSRIKSKEFKYLSPGWLTESVDPKNGKDQGAWLISAGLVPIPAQTGIKPVAAASSATKQQPTKEGVAMREEIAKALGVVEMTDSDVIKKVQSLTLEASQSAEKLKTIELENSKLMERMEFVKSENDKLTKECAELKGQIESHKVETFNKEVNSEIERLDKEGKFSILADVREAEKESLKRAAEKYGREEFEYQKSIIEKRQPQIETGKAFSTAAASPAVDKTKVFTADKSFDDLASVTNGKGE